MLVGVAAAEFKCYEMKIITKYALSAIFIILISGCVSIRQAKEAIGEIGYYKAQEIIQDRIIVIIASSYYLKEGKWPKSLDDLKEFSDREMVSKSQGKNEIKPDWDMFSSTNLSVLQNNSLKIEYDALLEKALGDNFKFTPEATKFTFKIDGSDINASIFIEKYRKIIEIEPPKKNIIKNGS